MILGIDLGTSMVKAALFGPDGDCIAVAARRSSPTACGQGRMEQDFEEIVTAVGEVVAEACAGRPAPKAIGITGQSDGLWLLDRDGRGCGRAVSWLDDRGNPYLQDWIDRGVFEAVFRRNGNAIFPGSHAPLMAAISAAAPDRLARAHTASYLKDGILQRLTGARVTDASDASLPFLDVVARDYDPEILRMLGLEHCEHLLAPVMRAPGQAFALNLEGAALIGLPAGIPVHAGPFDLVACPIGAGVQRPGDGLIIIGTTLACEVLVDRVDTSGPAVGMTLCMPQNDRWIRSMPATVGTATLDWVLSLVGASHKDVDALLAESSPGSRGVTALPFFSATGERAPFVDVRARGQLAGLSTATTRADLVRSVCESVAYAARQCIEAAGLTGTLSVCGGGSNSITWSRMVADALQRPLCIARRPEVGARGAAMVAMDVVGIAYDRDLWTRPEGVIEPRRERAALHEAGFAHYQEIVESARHLWHSPNRDLCHMPREKLPCPVT